ISRSLESAVDYFDWLDLKTESDFAEIREAYARMKEKISLEGAPESVKKELSQYHYKLGAMLDHAVTILTDPQKRYDYEQGLFDKMLQTRQRPKDKEELARQQWRRGTWYLSVANKPELARRCFQQALETDQKKAKYPAYVGWALYIKNESAKDRNTALEYIEHSLKMKPNYDQAHYFLGVIKKRQGEREEALEHFRKALKANPENTGADREYHLMRSRDKQASIFKRLFGKPG
ncbi:MAG: tetratricopeptide repeat protein, partial [bacterium]